MNKNPVIFLSVLCLLLTSLTYSFGADYNITAFGAKGDGKTINTNIINSVIIKCNAAGGGTVIIPTGTFISGTVLLLSNVNLHLQAGAVLKGSTDTADYYPIADKIFWSEGYKHYGLVLAKKAKNISITGQGRLDGNGTHFMNGIDKPHNSGDFARKYTRQVENYMKVGELVEDGPISYAYRPGYMINFEHCENIQVLNEALP